MKIFKFLAMLTISVLLFTGCEKEEITNYAFQEISAPTDVMAVFDVAQDDSGDVLITPSGEGAQVFQVYFGDGDDSPVEVAQGETVSYSYNEGEYLVRVVAEGSTGLTSEFNQRLIISFRAPENLVVNVAQASNPAMVTVSASADYAATFDVYFGEGDDEEPTQLLPDGSIDYTYGSPGTYTIRVVAKGAGVATTETTVEVVVDESKVATSLPITFENNETLSGVFEDTQGVTGKPVANPDKSGINTSEMVYEFTKAEGAAWYSGIFQIFPENIDLSSGSTFTFKIWSPKAGINVRMNLEKEGGEGGPTVSLDQTLTESEQWVTLTYDFEGIVDAADAYDKIVIFPEFDDVNQPAGDGSVYYLDDIAQVEIMGDPIKLPLTFDEDLSYSSAANGLPFEVVTNPNQSGDNSTDTKVGSVTNAGSQYEALTIDLDEAIDFSVNKTITMKVYSEVAYPVLFKLETGVNGERANEVEVNHGGTGWEVLTFDFNNARKSYVDGDAENGAAFVPTGQYDQFSIFLDFAGTTAGTFYIDDIIQLGASTGGGSSSATFGLPVDFDGSATYTTGSNSVAFEVVTNPELSGINDTETKVGAVTNNGVDYEALSFILDQAIDFSGSNKTITMKVYSETAYPVVLKLETGVNGERANEVEVNHGGSGWEVLTFDFNTARKSYVDGDAENGAAFVAVGEYDEISLFLDFAGTTAGTFYIDDIEQN